ncbi:MAG: transporter [Flavobacteriales bacterium]
MTSKYLYLILISTLTYNLSVAQIITDRPDQTESSFTVGAGNLQIETGFGFAYEGADASVTQLLTPSSLFRYGICEKVELRLLTQIETLKIGDQNVTGMSDFEIGTKISLFSATETKPFDVAFLSHLRVPRGSSELSYYPKFGSINKLAISHDINSELSIGYNVGYNYFGENNGDFTYSVALGAGVNDRVGIYIEPYGEWIDFEDFKSNIDAGFTYLVNKDLQLDFSFGTGLNHRMNYTSVGCSWLIQKK